MDQQSRHLLTLIGVCTVLVVAALYALHGILFQDVKSMAAAADESQVFRFSKGEVESMLVRTKGGNAFLRYGDGDLTQGWQIASPFQDEADQGVVQLMLDALEKVRSDQKFEGDDARPESFGLDKPAVEIQLAMVDGKRHRIRIGEAQAVDGTDYVQVDDSKAILKTATPLRFALEKSPAELRNRMFLRVRSSFVEMVQVYDGQRALRLHVRKMPDGRWAMGKPVSARAAPEAMERILKALDDAQVSRVVADKVIPESSKVIFAKVKMRLKLTFRNLRSIEYVFTDAPAGGSAAFLAAEANDAERMSDTAGQGPYVWFRRADVPRIFEIPASFLEPFLLNGAELRDSHALSFSVQEVHSMDMRLADGALSIRKAPEPKDGEAPSSSEWLLDESQTLPKAFPTEMAKAILDLFQSLKATGFDDDRNASLEDKGLAHPGIVWIFRDRSGRSISSLFSGGEADGGDYWFKAVDADGSQQILTISKEQAAMLPRIVQDVKGTGWNPGALPK